MVAVRAPLEGLYDKPVSVSAPCVPVAPSTNTGYTVSSVLLLAVTVTLVANAAVPDVSWLPAEFTPGKSMLAVPSKDTPPIFLAVCNAVAVAALPVHDPDEPDVLPVTSPVTSPVISPTNDVAVSAPDDELNVRLVPVLGARFPVAPVANTTLHEVSDDSSANVICVAAPVRSPVTPPFAVIAPVKVEASATVSPSKVVAPSTSKVPAMVAFPFASIAPVNVVIPATSTFLVTSRSSVVI